MRMLKIRELSDLGWIYGENKNHKIQITYEEFHKDESFEDRCGRMMNRVREENTICIMRNVRLPNIKEVSFMPNGDAMMNIRLKPKDLSQELIIDNNNSFDLALKVKDVYVLPFTDNSPLLSCLLPYTVPWNLSQECEMIYDICILNNELRKSLCQLDNNVSLQIDTHDGTYSYMYHNIGKLSKYPRETNPYSAHITTCDNNISLGPLCTNSVQIGDEETEVVINGVVFQNLLDRLEELETRVLELEYRPPELGGKFYEEALNSWRTHTESLAKK